jgi:hypothetical protein
MMKKRILLLGSALVLGLGLASSGFAANYAWSLLQKTAKKGDVVSTTKNLWISDQSTRDLAFAISNNLCSDCIYVGTAKSFLHRKLGIQDSWVAAAETGTIDNVPVTIVTVDPNVTLSKVKGAIKNSGYQTAVVL